MAAVEVFGTDASRRGVATCGTCGRSWDDTVCTDVTPTPAGRCPFEYDHTEEQRGMSVDSIRAICEECGYRGSLRSLQLHSCQIQEQGGRCEDYPCCGHTDGDGCQTLPEHTSAYYLANPASTHLGCDHNTGYCEYEECDEDEEDLDA